MPRAQNAMSHFGGLFVVCDLFISSKLTVLFVCPCYLCFPLTHWTSKVPGRLDRRFQIMVPYKWTLQTALAVGSFLLKALEELQIHHDKFMESVEKAAMWWLDAFVWKQEVWHGTCRCCGCWKKGSLFCPVNDFWLRLVVYVKVSYPTWSTNHWLIKQIRCSGNATKRYQPKL